MSGRTSTLAVAHLPRSAPGRWRVRLRAHRHRDRLDAQLAAGADPWSAPELLVRASHLGSVAQRRKLATKLHERVAVATRFRQAPFVLERHRVVLAQRESIIDLAERLVQPAPVEVAVVAQLAVMCRAYRDPCMPAGAIRPGTPI